MKFVKQMILLLTAAGLFFGAVACSDSSTSADDSEAIINGSIENDSAQEKANSQAASAEGVVVAAAQITSSGSFETIDGTETETDASGNFSVSVDADIAQHFAVVAQSSSGEIKGFLSVQVENGQNYTLKPLNAESTAETGVFASVIADGNTHLVHKFDIEAAIQSHSAEAIHSSSSAAGHIAGALAASAEARTELFSQFDADFEQAVELMTEAQMQLESNLAAASDSSDREAAYEAFLELKTQAHIEAGLTASETAKTLHAHAKLVANNLSSASSEVRNGTAASLSLLTAVATDGAVQAEAQAAGMSSATVNAISEAGVTLRNSIKASGSAIAEIETAFETYHGEVRSALEADSSTEASVVIAIDTEINVTGGPKFIFENDLSGVIDIGLFSETYFTFFSSVAAIVESQSELLGDVDTEAFTRLMILINLSS